MALVMHHWAHHGCQVGHARTEFVGRRIAFPAERDGFGGGVTAVCVGHEVETGLPRLAGRGEVAVAVGKETAQWPAWFSGRNLEGDDLPEVVSFPPP